MVLCSFVYVGVGLSVVGRRGAGGVQVSLFAGGMMVGILENPKT